VQIERDVDLQLTAQALDLFLVDEVHHVEIAEMTPIVA
jgi:hypothetical protein